MDDLGPTNKKRKPSCVVEEDSENEEEKINKFFAIIRNIQEARDRFMAGTSSSSSVFDASKGMNKKRRGEEKEGFAWKPSFEREDFVEREKQGGGGGGVDGDGRKQEGGAASPQVVVVEKDECREEVNLSLSL